jgi:hypothetical protein
MAARFVKDQVSGFIAVVRIHDWSWAANRRRRASATRPDGDPEVSFHDAPNHEPSRLTY